MCGLVLGVWTSSHFELVDIWENFTRLESRDRVLLRPRRGVEQAKGQDSDFRSEGPVLLCELEEVT